MKMTRESLKFFPDTLIHTYQNTCKGILLFYSREDRLVYFTIFATIARKYPDITVVGLCLMFDHIHKALKALRKESLSGLEQQTARSFSKAVNQDAGRSGRLFRSPFGSALKVGLKKAKTGLNYLYNNPVEKKLTRDVEKSRWNFLPYAISDHPFSERLNLHTASYYMKAAVAEVKTCFRKNLWLNYARLRRMFAKLNEAEQEQLTDFIISLFNPIDYNALVAYYGPIGKGRKHVWHRCGNGWRRELVCSPEFTCSYRTMVQAMNANTGSEYDIVMDWSPQPDTAYVEMIEYVRTTIGHDNVKAVLGWSPEEKSKLFRQLSRATSAAPNQIQKFLQL